MSHSAAFVYRPACAWQLHGLQSLRAVAQAHAFAEGLEKNGADRTLQHGFADALALMARIKAAPQPISTAPASPETAPSISHGDRDPAALWELSPELPPPGEHEPQHDEGSESADRASTGQDLAGDAAGGAPASADTAVVDDGNEDCGAAEDHAPDKEQPEEALEGEAAAFDTGPLEPTAEAEQVATVEEAGEEQVDDAGSSCGGVQEEEAVAGDEGDEEG